VTKSSTIHQPEEPWPDGIEIKSTKNHADSIKTLFDRLIDMEITAAEMTSVDLLMSCSADSCFVDGLFC